MAACSVCSNPDVGDVCSLCGSVPRAASASDHAPQPPAQAPAPTPSPSTPSQPDSWSHTPSAPVPTTTPSLPPSSSGGTPNRAGVVLGGIAAVTVLGGLIAFLVGGGGDDSGPAVATYTETITSTTTSSTSYVPVSPSETEESPTTTASPEEELEALRQESLEHYNPDGRWVVGLSAKRDGITDLSQTTRDGSHTFGLQDILELHEDLASSNVQHGAVYLVLAQDIGSAQGPDDDTLWMTILDPGGLSSREDAQAWCEQTFPFKSHEALANVCYPRELDAP